MMQAPAALLSAQAASVARLAAAIWDKKGCFSPLVFTPSLPISEVFGWYKALRTDEVKLDTMVMNMKDLRDTDTKFGVPVFFIQGADDNVTPTSLVADYERKIQAPVKKIDVAPDAGHFVMWTHANEFLPLLGADLRSTSTIFPAGTNGR